MAESNLHEHKVRSFFNKPTGRHSYLEKRFGVDIRAYVTRKLLRDVTHSAILDIGCGDGTLSLQYASGENELTLVDFSDKMLECARKNTPWEHIQDTKYLKIDFLKYVPDQPFDIVLCIGVLAHLQSLDECVKKLNYLLKPGGLCLIQFTDYSSWITKLDVLYSSLLRAIGKDTRKYPLQRIFYSDVLGCFSKNGFEVVEQCRYSLLLPGMGRLPNKFLYKYEMFTLKSPYLSRLGTEVILLLKKCN